MQKAGDYGLAINLKIDGLSYLLLGDKKILQTETFEWKAMDWVVASKKFASIFEEQEQLFKATFSKVMVFVQSLENTLIPAAYYDESNQQLALDTYLGRTDFKAHSHSLKQLKANLVYGINSTLDKLIQNQFQKAQIIHQSSLFIDHELKKALSTDFVSLRISSQSFEVIGIKAKQLKAHNHFEYQTVDELIFDLV